MANPRKVFRIDEVGTQRATFAGKSGDFTYDATKAKGTAYPNEPVKITGDMEVGVCADGDVPFGSVDHIEADGAVVVAYKGAVVFAGAGTLDAGVVGAGAHEVKAGVDGAGAGRVVTTTDDTVTAIL